MTSLELVINEDALVPAERFFRAGVDLLAWLDDLNEVPCDWAITQLRTGSAVAVISATEATSESDDAMVSAVAGLRSAAAGHVLDGWTPDAVDSAAKFADNFAGPSGGRSHLRLVRDDDSRSETDAVDLTERLGAQVAALKPPTRTVPGTVRGKLLGVNVNRGNRASVRTRAGQTVRVGFSNVLREALKDAMYKAVDLRGRVKKDPSGKTFHITAFEVHEIEKPDIDWTQLFGCAPEFTGGADRHEFLERLRGPA